tara:strand:- start:1960 stop:2760 length:801 start_codon:yes stop_codon:yes gene_type:complete
MSRISAIHLISSAFCFLGIFSCQKENSNPTEVYKNQIIVDNPVQNVIFARISIPLVTVNQASWLSVHPDNGDLSPDLNRSFSHAILLEKGNHRNLQYVFVERDIEFKNGDLLWLVLHESTGAQSYDFITDSSQDPPLYNSEGVIAEMIQIRFASIKMRENENNDSLFYIEKLQTTAASSFVVLSILDPFKFSQDPIADSIASYHLNKVQTLENVTLNFKFKEQLKVGDILLATIIWDRNENGICERFIDFGERNNKGPISDTIYIR